MIDEKPDTENGYTPEGLKLVRKTCLYTAIKMGDLLEDAVVVGGFVPSLFIDGISSGDEYKNAISEHVGTLDLDLGLSFGLLDKGRYKEFAKRLRKAGFVNDVKSSGEKRTHRWIMEMEGHNVELDFLIGKPEDKEREGGQIINIEDDFSAIVVPGLRLAFKDYEKIQITEEIPKEGIAEREINVAGPAAFIVLKALAFDSRGENKDAYDLFYVLRNYEGGTAEIAKRFENFKNNPNVAKSLEVLRRDFMDEDMVGPQKVANFLAGNDQEAQTKADVVAFVSEFLRELKRV